MAGKSGQDEDSELVLETESVVNTTSIKLGQNQTLSGKQVDKLKPPMNGAKQSMVYDLYEPNVTWFAMT